MFALEDQAIPGTDQFCLRDSRVDELGKKLRECRLKWNGVRREEKWLKGELRR